VPLLPERTRLARSLDGAPPSRESPNGSPAQPPRSGCLAGATSRRTMSDGSKAIGRQPRVQAPIGPIASAPIGLTRQAARP
jgi:hypothetical protein